MKQQNDSLNYSNTFFTNGKTFYHRCGKTTQVYNLYSCFYAIKNELIVCYYDDICDFSVPGWVSIVADRINPKAFFLTESGNSELTDKIDLNIYKPLTI